MTRRKISIVAFLGLIVLLGSLETAFAEDKVFIVTNEAAKDLAKDFITTLNNESIPLSIAMDQFDKIKKEKYIIVLGGAKGPGGVDGFIKQILTAEEQKAAGQPDGKMFVKENVFSQGQKIIVFAGPDEAAAANARKNSRKTWWDCLVKWFDLDTSAPMPY
jgi:hypothetical protein